MTDLLGRLSDDDGRVLVTAILEAFTLNELHVDRATDIYTRLTKIDRDFAALQPYEGVTRTAVEGAVEIAEAACARAINDATAAEDVIFRMTGRTIEQLKGLYPERAE